MFLKKRSLAILLYIALSVSLFAGLSSGHEVSADAGPDLFFSEYVEGSENNKAVEIFNASADPVELDDYEVRIYSNGQTSFRKVSLSSYTLLAGQTYVLAHKEAHLDGFTPNQVHTFLSHNGNDAVVLYKGEVAIDRIGRVGEDPGDGGWGHGDVRTTDQTLIRKSQVTRGDNRTEDPFDATEEWISVGKDNFEYLGSHPHEPTIEVAFMAGSKGSFNEAGPAGSQPLLENQSTVTPTLVPDEAYLAVSWDKDFHRMQASQTIEAIYRDRTNPGLFFSKYVEGSGNNKALEIYNPTDQTIDLNGYKIEIYYDGETDAGDTITLPHYSLERRDVFVITHDKAEVDLKEYDSNIEFSDRTKLKFNGNDLVVLVDPDGKVIDMIGKKGEGAGEKTTSSFTAEMIVGWYSGKVQTGNRTLVRKPWVTEGLDTRNLAVFDPSLQWEVHPQDTFDVLGSHVCYPTRTLSFDCGGGEPIPSIEKNYGTPIDEPAAPKRTGYEFLGWDQEFPEAMPTANLTLTANWRGLPYTMDFDSAGGTEVAPITLGAGTLVQPPDDPVRTGHRFLGWEPALPETMPVDGGSYTALWEVNHYTITFDSQGGSPVAPIIQAYGSPIDPPADPVREGYDFLGWEPGLPDRMPDGDLTVKALWGLQVLVDGGEDKVPATGEGSMNLLALVFMGLALGLALVIARRSRVGRA